MEALAGFSSSSSSTGQRVLVAVEVDGPTHVAVSCPSHQLGATVCRNWLLQQWGWTVLVVPWWQWQARQDTAEVLSEGS
jgi:very-short-patch-repair endonuclease